MAPPTIRPIMRISSNQAQAWMTSKRTLLLLFLFAYAIASVGIFYLRPTPNTLVDHASANEKMGLPLPERTAIHENRHSINEQQEQGQEPQNRPVKEEKQEEEEEEELPEQLDYSRLPADNKVYQVINQKGQCLALQSDESEHGCPLLAFEPCNLNSQKQGWRFTGDSLMSGGRCLDIYKDQSKVHACSCFGATNQQWTLEDYLIRSRFGSKKCLSSYPTGVRVEDCSAGGEANIQFRFQRLPEQFQPKLPKLPASTYKRIPKGGFVVNGKTSFADEESMAYVKQMMLHAWTGYVTYAWGQDELKPVSKTARNWMGNGISATIIDSLDTLYIMGLMDEFQQARDFVAKSLHFDRDMTVSFFETVIRGLGGLLAAYGLTKDQIFLEKAQDLGDRLLPAFNSPSGLPFGLVNLRSGAGMNQRWNPSNHILAEVGTVQLEFKYLSELTGQPRYAEKANRVMEIMKDQDDPNPGLYPLFISQSSGSSKGVVDYSLGGLGDSYYEYLLKQYLQTAKTEKRFKAWYQESAKGIKSLLLGKEMLGGELISYLGKYQSGYRENKMEHLACFAGGMFALGAQTHTSTEETEDIQVGKDLTKTCRLSYAHQLSGLGPEKFGFSDNKVVTDSGSFYILRPEYVESLFYLWRITKDQIYREWGWDVILALEKHSKTEVGYSGLDNVASASPPKNDVQESFFMAETLKYLYLLYTDDDVIPLDKFVFNTEAHPLPVFEPTAFHFSDSF